MLDNFLILSRISKSKNLETAIDAFLNSDFKDCSLDIIGGTLNVNDENYLKILKDYPMSISLFQLLLFQYTKD